VGTLLLLLPLLLLLLLYEAKDSLPTKNFIELRSNDMGTTAGERRAHNQGMFKPECGGVNCKGRD